MNNSAKQPETTTVLCSDGRDDFQATTTLSKTADTKSKNTRIRRMLTAVSMTVLALAASFGFVAATGEAAYGSVTVRPAVHVIVRKPLNNSWAVIQPAMHVIVRKPLNNSWVLAQPALHGIVRKPLNNGWMTAQPAVHVTVNKPMNHGWSIARPAMPVTLRNALNGNRGTLGNRLRTRASKKGGGAHPQNGSWH